ncbi:MAG: hypothetical protein A3I89_03235 [Candidatus Harrisonbacteria bacterium RIFCSPLOWO2_02_FULL_41_11]|uniref:Uncharacterized protein n=1 Tax=Candidatus Harrisonbacteria bacterium RIFCSPHIGHO2_02_FULL_42_16 TaxID=1798404 RepID=A0A1G1ZKK7_9BACT|nr:MAG: hypothetical protein A3B92_02725 [Candidatus Harrisonbacteria bacterium RIFCSPHIGHO2_02_FULL_42_16]OGY66252.1 MAG: hypothetical protein A3I89_03235 [Candidatus Harrisonbacteria bacterium RIFCSPLOWO2_02_FULL_41_11]
MKKLITISLLSLFIVAGLANLAEAAVRVRSYYKPSTGRYVMPSYRTSPNKTKLDNYSTKGNYNPYTGKKGYINPYQYQW